jgi:endoglucanase
VIYDQDAMNKTFSPKITTGAYGDRNFSDEFIWAASELYVTTKQSRFLEAVNLIPDQNMPLPSWAQVRLLGYYTLIKNSDLLGNSAPKELPELKKRLLAFADDLIAGADETAYKTVMTKSPARFHWGSNSDSANEGVALIQAYKLSNDPKYLVYALDNLDYLLGRNGTGYSYVTGHGSKTPMHPHHRPSASDGVVDPVPGLLVGGPNPGMQDHIRVPSTVPDEAYIDDDRAYAVNEIAINWNAPMAYLANAIEALQDKLHGTK